MTLDRSKNWWLRRLDAEPDVPIGAGLPDAHGAEIYIAPLRVRFARALGFGPAPYPFDEAFTFEGRDAIYVRTDCSLSLLDRLRVLVSGQVSVASVTRTSNVVGECQTRSIIRIPLWKDR